MTTTKQAEISEVVCRNTNAENKLLQDKYRIDIVFIKKARILLCKDKDQYVFPYKISSWRYSPEETAISCCEKQVSISIHQFDYPLGAYTVEHGEYHLTSYALVPSMWKEYKVKNERLWVSPLSFPRNTSAHTKRVLADYFHRIENEMTYGVPIN